MLGFNQAQTTWRWQQCRGWLIANLQTFLLNSPGSFVLQVLTSAKQEVVTAHHAVFFALAVPAPFLNSRLHCPPRKCVLSTPARRRRRKVQHQDSTPPTPTSMRTPSSRVSTASGHTSAAMSTHHSIMLCTSQLLTLASLIMWKWYVLSVRIWTHCLYFLLYILVSIFWMHPFEMVWT